MLRRLVTLVALSALALSTPAFAAAKAAKKPAATKKSTPAKKKAPAAASTATPVAEATPAPVKKGKALDRTFIKTTRAGWQEVVVGDKVIATRDNGSKVTGTIKEVSDYSIVIEPKKSEKVTIASNDLAQVFRDAN